MNSDECASVWPEQEAIFAWKEKHGIELTHEQERDLKESVTNIRIEIAHKIRAQQPQSSEWVSAASQAINLHEENEKLISLLRVARCPNTPCVDGVLIIESGNACNPVSCQWCYAKNQILPQPPQGFSNG